MRNDELDQILENSFRTEPEFHLSLNFAEKMTNVVTRNEQWKNDMIEYLSISGLIVLLLGVASGFYYFIDKEFVFKMIDFISKNMIQVVLLVGVLNFILFTDRVLLRLLFNKWNRT